MTVPLTYAIANFLILDNVFWFTIMQAVITSASVYDFLWERASGIIRSTSSLIIRASLPMVSVYRKITSCSKSWINELRIKRPTATSSGIICTSLGSSCTHFPYMDATDTWYILHSISSVLFDTPHPHSALDIVLCAIPNWLATNDCDQPLLIRILLRLSATNKLTLSMTTSFCRQRYGNVSHSISTATIMIINVCSNI